MSITKLSMISATAVFMGTTAYAGCGISSGNVSILGNEFAAIQAVIGQLYIAVLVARLVGLHIAHSTRNKP